MPSVSSQSAVHSWLSIFQYCDYKILKSWSSAVLCCITTPGYYEVWATWCTYVGQMQLDFFSHSLWSHRNLKEEFFEGLDLLPHLSLFAEVTPPSIVVVSNGWVICKSKVLLWTAWDMVCSRCCIVWLKLVVFRLQNTRQLKLCR